MNNVPPMPAGRGNDVSEALRHLRFTIGGANQVKWQRLFTFIALFRADGLIATLPPQCNDLVEMIDQFATPAVKATLEAQNQPADILHALQARIPMRVFTDAIKSKNAHSNYSRADLRDCVLQVCKGNPIKNPQALFPPLRTLIEFVNGPYDEAEFLAGSSAWQIRQGNRTTNFGGKTVYNAYLQFPQIPVLVTSRLFQGKTFPDHQECHALYQQLTWGEGVLNGPAVPLWVYANLGSSSYFNDLFGAWEEFQRVNGQGILTCEICNLTPCMALDTVFTPPWISRMRNAPANANKEALRHQIYKDCHPRYGYARVPLPDCWLLGIRLCLHGGSITGFRPRGTKDDNAHVQVVLEVDGEGAEIEGQGDEEEGDEEPLNDEGFLYQQDELFEHDG